MFTKIDKQITFFILCAILISAFFHFRSPNIPDPDSLYHLRHAQLLWTNGIFNTEFPWTYYSVMRTAGADLWYGLHLLLIPFPNLKVTGVFFTTILLLSFYWVGQRQKFNFAGWWPFLFLFSAPNAFFQILMVRPQILTMALSAMLVSVLSSSGSFLAVFLLGAAITFFHISFFWLAPGIAVLNLVIRLVQKNDWLKGIKDFFAVLVGTFLGMVLRPEPLAALKLVYIQVLKLIVEKQSALPILFSRELAPLSFDALTKTAPIFLILWLAGTVIFSWQSMSKVNQKDIALEQKRFLWLSGILSFGFLLMTLVVARRSLMFWPGFGVLFIAGVYSFLPLKKSTQELFSVILLISILLMAPITLSQNTVSMKHNAMPPNHLREAAEWLRDHSESGDIVFNAHWDNFAPLFFWNQTNYYIGGMDPIFQYAYDPELYWKFHHISIDEFGDLTCGEIECHKQNVQDVYSVFKNDFQARYVFVEKKRNPNFQRAMELDSRFKKQFDNGKETVFLIR